INAVTYQLLVLVREFDDRMGWAKWGYQNCAEWLSWRCQISLSAAREKVRTAQALRDLPAISLAFREGRLSYTKARAMTRVALEHGEDALLRYALDASAPAVEERCRQIRNVHPESVHDARRAWEARALSAWNNAARGTLCLRAELPLELGELVMKAIERALEREEIPDGVADRSPSSFPSQQADALVAIMTTYLEGGAVESGSSSTADRYQVVLHVDEAALHGGPGRADAPLETVKRLACDASLVVVTEDERGTPLGVSPKQRVVSTPLRRALVARDRRCAFPGCPCTKFLQAHHVEHWVEGGETTLRNLLLLCPYHHRLLHEGGYRIGRDYQGELYFMRVDGRAIPRCGYRVDDYTDDYPAGNPSNAESDYESPSMEDSPHVDADHATPSMEVREPRGVYDLRLT
ncbi:MAG TPA: DUF222 domain-containing protein, partial [Rhodanobacteraceae bacterium]|nr:DUF222 domain-containing protein [Rhodanobacteraceae bacterium]